MEIFHSECETCGIMHDPGEIFEYLKQFPEEKNLQLSLF